MRRALVSVAGSEGARGAGRTVVTDDDGRFALTGLPAGRYTITASKPGFVASPYGSRRPGRPGTPIQLAAGQRLDPITVRLVRGAVVTGTVVDPNGEPMPSGRVTLMRYVYSAQNGERTLQPTSFSATSDDRGVYRIYGITPGDYLAQLSPPFSLPGDLRRTTAQSLQDALQQLRAPATANPPTEAQAAQTGRAPSVAYAPIFYPASTSPANAGLIKLAAGEERAGVDLQSQLVPTAKVEGVVLAADGSPGAGAQVTILGAGPADISMTSIMATMFGGGRPDAQGRFTLSGVAPGHYTIAARTGVPARGAGPGGPAAGAAAAASAAPVSWATAEVDVNGADISGVRLTLEPGMRIAGRVAFQGTAAPPQDLTTVRITLTPVLTGSSVAVVIAPVQADAQGNFALSNVTPGHYRLSAVPSTAPAAAGAAPLASPWVLASASAQGRETLDTGFDVRPGEPIADAVLTFTDRATTLGGTLQDAGGRPASDYFIIVYASDKTFWTPPSRRVTMTRPANDGKFSVRGLPPGEYLIAAVTDVDQAEWMDPAFLEQLVGASVRVTLADGESRTQDIRIAR